MLPHEPLPSLAPQSPGTTMQQSKLVTAGRREEQQQQFGRQSAMTARGEDFLDHPV